MADEPGDMLGDDTERALALFASDMKLTRADAVESLVGTSLTKLGYMPYCLDEAERDSEARPADS